MEISDTQSSNTLFHMTPSFENIKGILTYGFYPHYCLENLGFLSEDNFHELPIPMVSFCDIPLSRIKRHLNKYGNYGIGMKKEWGMTIGISPVFYIENKSKTKKNVKYDIIITITELLYFCKAYEGNLPQRDNINIRFYDEREWRYVPRMDNELKTLMSVKQYKAKRVGGENKLNLRISNSVKFTPDDIKYIIVEKENELLQAVDDIMTIKSNDYPYNTLKKLTTRLISAESLTEDF